MTELMREMMRGGEVPTSRGRVTIAAEAFGIGMVWGTTADGVTWRVANVGTAAEHMTRLGPVPDGADGGDDDLCAAHGCLAWQCSDLHVYGEPVHPAPRVRAEAFPNQEEGVF